MLQHVTGEGHGEIEVQPEACVLALCHLLESPQHVDLLGGLPLAHQLLEGFDGPGLQAGEPVQFEGGCQGGHRLGLHETLAGQEFGESAQRRGPAHRADSEPAAPRSRFCRYGLVRRSIPMVL